MDLKAARQGILIGAVAAALASILWFANVLDGWEATTWNWRVKTLAERGENSDDIVLVLLDQASLDWGEEENDLTWPWPRAVYVPLIDFCTRAEARSVSFDVLFTEASGFGVWDDQALGDAISRNGRFVGARFLSPPGTAASEFRVDDPIVEVQANVRLLANVSDAPDGDGLFRRANLRRTHEKEVVPSLGAAAWMVGSHVGLGQLPSMLTAVPLDKQGSALLNYRKKGTYTTFNAAAIIQSELRLQEGGEPPVDLSALRDKYVLFGFSAPGLMDLRPTPLSRVSPGVLIHATVLDNLMSRDFMRDVPGWMTAAGTSFLALMIGLLATVFPGIRTTAIWLLVVVGVPLVAGFWAYTAGWWWPILPLVLAASLSLFGSVVRNFAAEGSQKRFIKQAFRHYLSPAVIDRILEDPKALKLGGERRELTIMFSDLAGFTSLSEGLEPEELTTLLNDYLTDMTDIILEEGGTLDKYEGDAILAFWNAPLNQDDHARRACRASVRCQRQLAARRAEFKKRCGHELHARIGLHTGPVVVGNMGSKQRFDYTVLGDAANLASRLEGANKIFDTGILISESTRNQASDFQVRGLGPLQVVGRQEPVEVFDLVGLPGEAALDSQQIFTAAVAAWRAGDVAQGASLFQDIEADPVAQKMATLCRDHDAWNSEGKMMWTPSQK